jgi:hypothetical protein
MWLLPLLINKAHELGFELTQGDGFRDPRVFGKMGERRGYGESNSCHKLKLAKDINLFKNGDYLEDTEHHRELGEFWESLHPLCRWGGRFQDGNHYSLTHDGHM